MKSDQFIGKQIERTTRNLLLTNFSILAVIIVLWLSKAFSSAGYWGLAVFGLVLLTCWNIIKVWKRQNNPSLHPVTLALTKLGSPEQIAGVINKEVKTPALVTKKAIVTESWLLIPSMYTLEMIPLEQLVWVHKKVTQQSTYGVSTRKNFAVVVYKHDGHSLEVSCGEHDSNRLCEEAVKRAPWVVCGFNDDIQRMWNADKAGFIAHIDQRKREIKGETVEPSKVEPAKEETPISRKPQGQTAPRIQAEMKRRIILILFLVGIPLATLLVGIWADSHLGGQWKDVLVKYSKEQGITPTEQGLAALSLGNVCAGLTDLDTKKISDLCDSNDKLQLLIGLSIATGVGGFLILLLTTLAGWVARLHRFLLLTIFTTGLYVSLVLGVVLLLSHGALIMLAIYYGEGVLAGQIHTGVMVGVGIAMITGMFKLIAPAFHSIRRIDTVAFGKLLSRDRYPAVWSLVEDAGKRLRALQPDHIVACLGEAFYVTEANVACLDGQLKGRTLVLSLPFMRQLTHEELLAIVGHELGHFRGADTTYSRSFYPIYKGTQEALGNLLGGQQSEGSIVYLPVLGLLDHFVNVFSRVERGFSRTRELVADQCGTSLTTNEIMATALTKVYAYSGLWSVVNQSMVEALEHGKQLTNGSSFFGQVLSVTNREILEKNLSTSILEHPTDTHPPFKMRMEKLGYRIDHFLSAIQALPANPSSNVISEVETLEKELTELEHIRLLKEGVVKLPPKQDQAQANSEQKQDG